ncbi:hypothetical protein MY11210_003117 [Beauveria gryllotalpidicola]
MSDAAGTFRVTALAKQPDLINMTQSAESHATNGDGALARWRPRVCVEHHTDSRPNCITAVCIQEQEQGQKLQILVAINKQKPKENDVTLGIICSGFNQMFARLSDFEGAFISFFPATLPRTDLQEGSRIRKSQRRPPSAKRSTPAPPPRARAAFDAQTHKTLTEGKFHAKSPAPLPNPVAAPRAGHPGSSAPARTPVFCAAACSGHTPSSLYMPRAATASSIRDGGCRRRAEFRPLQVTLNRMLEQKIRRSAAALLHSVGGRRRGRRRQHLYPDPCESNLLDGDALRHDDRGEEPGLGGRGRTGREQHFGAFGRERLFGSFEDVLLVK